MKVAEVEVLEARDAAAALDRQLGVAQRVVGLDDRRDRPPDPDRHVRQAVGQRGQHVVRVALDEDGERVVAAVDEVRDLAPARARLTSSRRTPVRSSLERITTIRAGCEKSSPKAAARAASGSGSRARDRLERLLEQRRLDGQLLVAHHVAQPRHRGQQRRGRLGGGLGELADEPAPRAGEHEPRARRPAVATACQPLDLQLDEPGRLLADRAEQLVDGRLAGHDVGPALGADQHHAGVEEARQPVDHRALGLRRAQRVDEVALERRQPPEDLLLAADQRAVDEVDDLPERRLVGDREDREGVLARDRDERRRHALERQPDPEAERARPALLELRDQRRAARRRCRAAGRRW